MDDDGVDGAFGEVSSSSVMMRLCVNARLIGESNGPQEFRTSMVSNAMSFELVFTTNRQPADYRGSFASPAARLRLP